jgi:DNA mismatch repair ATPase MutS
MWTSSVLLSAIFILLCILAFYFFYRAFRSRRLQQIKEELKADWTKENLRFRDMSRIAVYDNQLREQNHVEDRSRKTRVDLNMDAVFAKLDRCKSKIGQQYLYAMLHHPIANKAELEERNAAIRFFQEQEGSRTSVQLELQRLNAHLSYSIPNIIFNWKLEAGTNKLLILALSLLPLFILGLCIWVSKAFALLLALSFFVNLLFHYRNKSRVEFFISPFSQIPALRASALRLSRLHPNFQNEEIRAACKKLSAFGRYQFLLQSEKSGQNEFTAFLWLFLEYLKITFLFEINLLDRCLEISRNAKSEIHTLYKYIGKLDSYQSLASYRDGLKYYCIPKFDNSHPHIGLEQAFHPLLDHCQPNSLVSETKGIIITGSNMSGKTTFIRTVAINAILAQTICTVCASKYRSSFLTVHTAIGIQDDLLAGNSYYKAEIDAIQYFLQQTKHGAGFNLFVIDELFKGTNTMERVAAAKGVLEYLIKGRNMVLVSTHDLELPELLHPAYGQYHFQELVGADGYLFDYKIKDGTLKTRNAIRLLEVSGFPEEIIMSANAYLDATVNAPLKPMLESNDARTDLN